MKTKRNLLVSIMAMVMALCAFCGIMTMTNTAKADAISGLSVAKFTSIKVDEPQIRFYAVMDADAKAQAEANGYGFLIFPQSYYTNEKANLDTENFHALAKKVEIPGDIAKIYPHEEGTFAVTATLKDIQADSFAIRFTCVAYIGNAEVGYSYAYDQDLGVSIQDIASKNYLDVKEDENQKEVLMNTYGPDSIYGFGSTNPILVTDGAQMSYIADQVAADADYALNFKLDSDITLPNGATLANTYKGTFDGNGKTVTADFAAVLVDGKTTTDLNYTESILTPADYINFDTDYVAYDVRNNPDGEKGRLYQGNTNSYLDKGEVLSKEEWQADGVTGNYNGNLIKSSGYYYTTWQIVGKYSDAQLEAIVDYYDYARFYLGVINTDTAVTKLSYPVNYFVYTAEGATSTTKLGSQSFNIDTANGTLYEIRIAISDFITAAKSGEMIQLFSIGWGSCTKNDKNSSGAAATYNLYQYFSEIEFVFESPVDPIIVDETSYETYKCASDSVTATRTYLTAEEVAALGFSGDYTGAATRFSDNVGNQVYYLNKSYTNAQLNYIKQNYTSVSIWVAKQVTLIDGGSSWTVFSGQLYPNGNWPNNNNKWINVKITVDRFIECVSGQTSIAVTKLAVQSISQIASMYCYLGDIQFIK